MSEAQDEELNDVDHSAARLCVREGKTQHSKRCGSKRPCSCNTAAQIFHYRFMYTLAKHCIAKMSLKAHQPYYRLRTNDEVHSTATKPELSRDELIL